MQETLDPASYLAVVGGIVLCSAAVVAAEQYVFRRYIAPAIEATHDYYSLPGSREDRTLLKAIGDRIRETEFP